MSQRSLLRSSGPATLPEPVYLDDDLVGLIRNNGCLRYRPDGRPIDLQLSIAFN